MADRYWVGGTANWDGTAGTKWATTSGGTGGASVPTTADDVFFTNLSTGTCTIATGNTGARSINCTGFAGTITGTATITVAGSVTLAAAMTYTHTGVVVFTGTGTLTTASKAFSNVTVDGAGITLTLGDDLNISTRSVSVLQGTFTTAGFNIQAGTFTSSSSATRTINLGGSVLTLSTSGTAVNITATNLTFNAGTSQINLSSSLGPNFSGGGLSYNNVSFTNTSTTASSSTILGANTFANLTISPFSTSGMRRILLNANQTITGTLNCGGATALRRIFIASDALGTSRTITAAAVAAPDCDFRDITIAGAAAPVSPTRAGNCGGNAGITFPAAKNCFRVGTDAVWTGISSWALTSGGTGDDNNFPLAQDTAVIDNSTTLTGTLTISDFNISGIDASTRTTGITLGFGASSIYGSVALGSGITVSGTGLITFSGRSTVDFTSAGKTLTFPITVDAPGGTFRLLDATTLSNTFTLTRGTLNLNNLTLTSTAFIGNNTNTRTLAFGTGNITVTGTGLAWSTLNVTGLTVTGTPVVNVTNATATATTVDVSALTSEADTISFNITSGTYTLTLSGNVRNLNFTGFAGSLSNQTRSVFGNLTLSTGMTLLSGNNVTSFVSTSATPRTITTNGKTIDFPLYFGGPGGTQQLLDALTMGSTRTLTHGFGTIDLNGFTLTAGFEYITGTGTKNLTFNGGTLTCGGIGGFNNAAPTGFTTTAGTGTGTINMVDFGGDATFEGGGATYNCTLNYSSGGDLYITGSNTFTTISNTTPGAVFVFESGSTTTLTNWNINGAVGNLTYIVSNASGSHTLSKASGIASANYLYIVDSNATGGAQWVASNSTDGGNNSGWTFNVGIGNFFMLLLR